MMWIGGDDAPKQDYIESGGGENRSLMVVAETKTETLGWTMCQPEPLPEGIYGAMIACYIRETYRLENGLQEGRTFKLIKVGVMTAIAFGALTLQFFLIQETKALVTPEAVISIRETYDAYQKHMYTDIAGVEHTVPCKDGYSRGVIGHFRVENFHTLDKEIKALACRIPLSQPKLTTAIIFIWTLTCVAELRTIMSLWKKLMCVPTGPNELTNLDPDHADDGEGEKEIKSLSCMLKTIINIVMISRIGMCSFLLWLGCRWLLATLAFGDLLMNAIALEFILLIRDLFYNTLVPFTLKVDTQQTFVPHEDKVQKPNCSSELGMFGIVMVAASWTYMYMYHLQLVLPDYRWDVHATCKAYLAEHLKVLC